MKGTFVYALPCAIVQLLFARVAATSISPVVFAPSQYWYVFIFRPCLDVEPCDSL